MYTVETTKQFDKSFKRCLKKDLDPELLWEVIELLQKDGTLPAQYRPHKLSGRFSGLWECHIKGDWLLIWQRNDTELILIMTDTGTHADLF